MSQEEEFQLENQLGLNLIVREYQEADSPRCCELDERLSGASMHGSKIIITKKYIDSFHAVFKESPEYFGILVEDRTEKTATKLIGMIFLTIKSVFYKQNKIKIGHIHSLRVDKEYRRFGIEAKLVEALESKSRARDVSIIEIWVSKESSSSVKLYEKLNYKPQFVQEWSMWAPKKLPKIPRELRMTRSLTLSFETIDKETIKKNWETFYKGSDLVPESWDDILKTNEYKNSYLVKSQDNSIRAGISKGVMKTNRISYYKKYYLPTTYYHSIFFNGVVLGLTGGMAYGLHYFLNKTFNLQKRITEAAAALFGGIIMSIYASFRNKVLAYEKESHSRSEYLIAPYYFGDEKYKRDAIMYLFYRVAETAKKEGPVHITLRAEEGNPFLAFMPYDRKADGYYMTKVLQNQELLGDKTKISYKPFLGFH